MTRTLSSPLKHHLAGLVGAVVVVLTPAANASYTVMEDDLYPTSHIQARDAVQTRQETIQFPRQRAILTKTAIASLDALLPSMSRAAIRIVGRPDATARNDGPLSELAAERAAAVRDYLMRKGIPYAAIKMEIDESPNPQRNGSLYPSEIYISTASAPRTDFTHYPPSQHAPQHQSVRHLPQQYEAPQAQAPILQPNVAATRAATNSGIATPPANPELIRFINASALNGQMSASVALQLLERLAPTLAPASPAPAPVTPPPTPPVLAPVQAQHPTWEILADDETLQNTFSRWGKLANWDVRWIGIPDIKNPGHVALPAGDFLATANHVLSQAQRVAKVAGIDLSITAYPNRVLVISKEN